MTTGPRGLISRPGYSLLQPPGPPRKDCSSGHKYAADKVHCKRCGKELSYADGMHVYDPRSGIHKIEEACKKPFTLVNG